MRLDSFMTQPKSHLLGCLLGGAVGDALGAPGEGIRTLSGIFDTFGVQGITDMHPYISPWEKVAQSGVGAITDDTTMCLTTLAALLMARNNYKRARYLSWQGYLNWGQHQEGGEGLTAHIDFSVDWPDEIKPFWFGCGAGRGTMAALSVGKPGSPEQRLTYDTTIRSKRVVGPNDGCGGMMRVAPIGFYQRETDKFAAGMRNAAITHGGNNAMLASGAVCQMVESAVTSDSLEYVFNRMMRRLSYEGKVEPFWSACETAWQTSQKAPAFQTIDELPGTLGIGNKFLSLAVLAQTIYTLGAVHHHNLGFKPALTLAVSHGGDSDSVGAIVGNILGARCGAENLPADWVNKLQMKPQIETIGRVAESEFKRWVTEPY